jgi:hypothetical protein
MDVIIDAARDFKLIAVNETKPMDFSIPAKISLSKLEDQKAAASIESKAGEDFEISFNSKNYESFSPHESLIKPFGTLFDYYFFHTLNQKFSGQEVDKVYVVLPLHFSMDVENIIIHSSLRKYKPIIFRDMEVYAAYYLNESTDVHEIKHVSEKDNSAHIYGNILTGDSICSFFLDYTPGVPPAIIDFARIYPFTDFFNTLKMNINKHSSKKSKIFYFIEEKVREKLNLPEYESTIKEFEKGIEKDFNIPIRSLRKIENEDPIIKGILSLKEKKETTPIFKLSLFTQETETNFSRIIPNKDINIAIDFHEKIPGEFFINLFIGPNQGNLILLKRVFLDMKHVNEKHVELKAAFDRVKNGLNYTLTFKDKIFKNDLIPLREQFQLK